MKGVVFTGFLDLVENNFGYEMVDKIITSSDLMSGGAYTSIGSYPHSELVQLSSQLSRYTEIPVPKQMKLYGQHFFWVLAAQYGHILSQVKTPFQLLESADGHIQVEVKKLYPDAELPQLTTRRVDDKTLEMIYTSKQKMVDFAEGLIESCLKYFDDNSTIEKTNLTKDGSTVRFIITKQ